MGRLFLLLVAVLAVAGAGFSSVGNSSASEPTEFRTPDAGAACRLEARALVCSSLGSDGSVALRAHGRPTVVTELPWWDAGTPVIRSFHRRGISCELAGEAIVCRGNHASVRVTGDGFAVTG